jgi:hypothetical protein
MEHEHTDLHCNYAVTTGCGTVRYLGGQLTVKRLHYNVNEATADGSE